MTFSEDYSEVLTPFVEKYSSAKNEKERKAVLGNAADAVKTSHDLREDEAIDLPKDLQRAIGRYIKGLIQKETSKDSDVPKPKKSKQKYNIRDVIRQLYRDRIEEEIPYDSNDPRHLGAYQKAVSTVHANMTEDELDEAGRTLESWHQEGVPRNMQVKKAKDKLPGEIKKKVDEWKFSSGALVMCLVSYYDGSEVRGFHVESSPNVGSAFTNTYKDWSDGTYDNFKAWSLKQFGVEELDSDDDAEVPVHMKRAKEIKFERNPKNGEFILPPISDLRTIRDRQRVVRGYVGAVYRKFTGKPRATFPYLLSQEEGQNIYSPESVPEGFILSDPDHLKAFQIDALYKHWELRQSKRLAPFVILNASPQHATSPKKSIKAKGKRKAPYVEVDSDDEEVKSSGDDVGSENSEEDVNSPVPRFGPPRGKKTPSSTKTNKNPGNVAGSSKIPSLNEVSKSTSKTRPVGGKVKEKKEGKAKKASLGVEVEESDRGRETPTDPTSKARPVGRKVKEKKEGKGKKASSEVQLEESNHGSVSEKVAGKKPVKSSSRKRKNEDSEEPPFKKIRLDNKVPKQGGAQKRRGEALEESSSKRKRLGGESSTYKTEEVTPARVREHARVKVFPAGNVTTSGSRIAFLQSLCKLPKFLTLVDLVPTVPKASPIPSEFPSWASWRSRDSYLPPNFHSSSSFNKIFFIARKSLEESLDSKGNNIDGPLLLLGLMYREVSRAMEIEPGGSTDAPEQLINSPFGIQQMRRIENLIDAAELP